MATLTDLLPDAHHRGIYGGSGSGKSYLARELHRVTDEAAIYVNFPEKKRDEYEVTGPTADRNSDVEDIKEALRKGMSIRYRTHPMPDVMDQELRQLYEVLKLLSCDVYVFIDEAHLFGDAMVYLLRDGRGHGVWGIPISQRPKDMGTTVFSQIDSEGDHVIFKVARTQRPWFGQMGLPYEDIDSWTRQDYHFVIMDGDDITRYEPIPGP